MVRLRGQGKWRSTRRANISFGTRCTLKAYQQKACGTGTMFYVSRQPVFQMSMGYIAVDCFRPQCSIGYFQTIVPRWRWRGFLSTSALSTVTSICIAGGGSGGGDRKHAGRIPLAAQRGSTLRGFSSNGVAMPIVSVMSSLSLDFSLEAIQVLYKYVGSSLHEG